MSRNMLGKEVGSFLLPLIDPEDVAIQISSPDTSPKSGTTS